MRKRIYNLKKIIAYLIIIVIIIPIFYSTNEKSNQSIKYNKKNLEKEKNYIHMNKLITVNTATQLSDLNILSGNDEGPHKNNIFDMKEWWYYNVFFNNEKSDLKNWFMLISIQIYPEYSGLKLELYDDNNKSYGGDKWLNIDDISSYGPGVNNFFNNSFQIGNYPNWHIYAEYNKKNDTKIIVNLSYNANSLPRWIVKNTGHNKSNSLFGYYCVINCSVKGTISINNSIYNVIGLGYYDHTWVPLNLKKHKIDENIKNLKVEKNLDVLKFWDWFCIHFDNGWDMFVGKIYLKSSKIFQNLIPGSLCFTPSGSDFYEIYFYQLEYLETNNSKIPNLEIPTKVHIKALYFNTLQYPFFRKPLLIDIYYEATNIREDLLGDPPIFGYWVSYGIVYGKAVFLGETIDLNGIAVMETTGEI